MGKVPGKKDTVKVADEYRGMNFGKSQSLFFDCQGAELHHWSQAG